MGRLPASPSSMARDWADGLLNASSLVIADHVVRAAADLGMSPAAVALAWVRQRPGLTSVIIGPRTLDQFRGYLAGLALDLPSEVLGHLDDISRSGGPAAVNGMNTRRTS